MKNLISLLVIVFLASGLSAQQTQMFKKTSKKTSGQTEEIFFLPGQKSKDSKPVKNTFKAKKSIWKPQKITLSFFEEGSWIEFITIQATYDQRSNVLTEDDGESLFTYTYDENNEVTSNIEQTYGPNGSLINASKKLYQYDSRVHDLVIDQQYFSASPVNGEWEKAYYHHKREIVRDNRGNVLSATVLLKDETDKFIEIEKIEVMYDEISGMAKTWKFSSHNNDGVFGETNRLENIKWENTDGQFVSDMSTLMLNNNRIKSADYYYNGKKYGKVTGVYSGTDPKSPDFEFTVASDDESEIEYNKYTQTDQYGSSKEIYRLKIGGELVEDTYKLVSIDQFGNMLKEEYYSNKESPDELVDGIKNDIEYLTDSDKAGTIKQLTSSMFDYETKAYNEAEREAYDDFINIILSIQSASKAPVLNCFVQNSSLHFTTENKAQYSIFSIHGVLLQRGNLAQGSHSIPLHSLISGIYFLQINDGKNTYATKFFRP